MGLKWVMPGFVKAFAGFEGGAFCQEELCFMRHDFSSLSWVMSKERNCRYFQEREWSIRIKDLFLSLCFSGKGRFILDMWFFLLEFSLGSQRKFCLLVMRVCPASLQFLMYMGATPLVLF